VPAMSAQTHVETEEVAAGPLRAYVAEPGAEPAATTDGRYPGVLVLHELFGLNDDMRRIARRFADNGYVAMAPDLLSNRSKLQCLTRVLTYLARGATHDTIADLSAARDALAARPDVDPGRVAVAGFCMGGAFALVLGTKRAGSTSTNPDVQATAVNYGAVPKDRSRLEGVCPVVASYGAADRVFGPQGERLRKHLEALGVPHDYKSYPDVGHSFFSWDNVPGWMAKLPSPMHPGYSEAEAEDGWARMLAFFSEHV
jgi:carboxymethylenebutenolidase